MKDNKTQETLAITYQLMKAWAQSHNFDLEVNRMRRQQNLEASLKRSIQLCLCVFRKKESLEKSSKHTPQNDLVVE